MKPYTLDEAFTFGYKGGLYNSFDKDQSPLQCSYFRAQRRPIDFQTECVRTAKLLAQQAAELGRAPTVLLSGGLDSEVVVKSFIEAEVPFEVRTFRFPNSLNDFETRYVDKFCSRHGLKPSYYDLDIQPWAQSAEAAEFFRLSNGEFFEMLPHMKLMQEVWDSGGLPILGNGDVYLEPVNKTWVYVEFEYILAWFRFAIARGILGGIAFFQHTPEQTLSMVQEGRIERLGFGRDKVGTAVLKNSRHLKYDVYRRYWPDLEKRPKFNGGEKLHAFYHKLAEPLRTGYNGRWTQPYSDFRANLEPISP